MKEDIDKLKEICANNPDYQLTLVYDGYVFCHQVRFNSRNPHIPCFVDVCIWDWPPLARAKMIPFALFESISWMLSRQE